MKDKNSSIIEDFRKNYTEKKKYVLGDFKHNTDPNVLYVNVSVPIENGIFDFQKDAIKTLILGDDVQVIGKSAFENYPNLETVIYGKKLRTVDSFAFAGCRKLSTFIPLSSINSDTLDYSDNVGTFECVKPLTELSKDCFTCTNFEKVAVKNKNVCFRAGSFESCHNLKDLYIEDWNTVFGVASFNGCPELMVHVNGTPRIKSIAKYAFNGTRFANLVSSNQLRLPEGNGEKHITKTDINNFKMQVVIAPNTNSRTANEIDGKEM